MPSKVAVYRIEDRVLIVSLRFVTRNPGQSQFIQHSRKVLVLELDGAVRPSDLGHQFPTMVEFNVGPTGKFGFEHREIIRHDCVQLVVLPIGTDLRFVSHFPADQYHYSERR